MILGFPEESLSLEHVHYVQGRDQGQEAGLFRAVSRKRSSLGAYFPRYYYVWWGTGWEIAQRGWSQMCRTVRAGLTASAIHPPRVKPLPGLLGRCRYPACLAWNSKKINMEHVQSRIPSDKTAVSLSILSGRLSGVGGGKLPSLRHNQQLAYMFTMSV